MRPLIVLFFLLSVVSAFAGDERFGVDTHFQQGWSINLIPSIKALGVTYIRDNYAGTVDATGKWLPPQWIYGVRDAGLKTVLIIGASSDDVPATVALSLAVAKSQLVAAIEIVNEANNVAIFQGAAGEQRLVDLTTAVTNAVHTAVGSKVQVIGLDEQGSQILYMLSLKPVFEGLVYHPYPPDNVSPTLAYEPPFTGYAAWVAAVRAATTRPIWETEWGFRGSPTGPYTYALQSSRILQRLALTQSLKIEHTFIYEFKDNGTENYGLCDNAGNPKPAYYAVQNFIATLPK